MYMKLKMPDPSAGPFAMPTLDSSHITRKWLDVDYTPEKPHPMRKLDIYLPEEGDGPFPALITVHGGAFSFGQKDDAQCALWCEAIPHGFAVVGVEQRLCNPKGGMFGAAEYNKEGVFPNPVFDVKAAIRFLRANAAAYKLDPSKFAIAGGSAGGYHAVIAAASANNPAMRDESLGYADVSEEVHAVVTQFGVGDMVVLSEFTEKTPAMPIPGSDQTFKMPNYADIFLGVNAREHPELAWFSTPSTWLTKDMPPIYIQHGVADEVVPVECSRLLRERIEQVCGKDRYVYEEFEGYTHADMRFNEDGNIQKIIAWLKTALNA